MQVVEGVANVLEAMDYSSVTRIPSVDSIVQNLFVRKKEEKRIGTYFNRNKVRILVQN